MPQDSNCHRLEEAPSTLPVPEQLVVPVLGMHRSGTSLVTRLFNLLGMELGWPLQPPSQDNPKGFWEHRLFQSVNINLLDALGHHTDGYGTPEQLGRCVADASRVNLSEAVRKDLAARLSRNFMHARWGWKDPRSTLLWPVWHRLLSEFGYTRIRPVLVVRHPAACVQSLRRRGDVGAAANQSGRDLETYLEQMWCSYYQLLLRSGVGRLKPLVLCQEDLLDPSTAPVEVARMAEHLGVDAEACHDALDWIDPSLDHRKVSSMVAGETATEMYTALVKQARRQRAGFMATEPSIPSWRQGDHAPAIPAAPAPYSIFVVSPLGYPFSKAFDEVALALHHGFRALGHRAPIVRDVSRIQGIPIVLGANQVGMFSDQAGALDGLPDGAILYNLEQIDPDSDWLSEEYMALLRRHRVWDYSPINAERLGDMGVQVEGVCGIGHVPELERIPTVPVQDIDVLFYGGMNERRKKIIDALEQRGVNVVVATNLYGSARDQVVGRAKIVLNIHFYEAKVLEMVRISYLLANGCTVVSEVGAEPQEEAEFTDAIAFAPYEDLVERCIELLAKPDERARLGERAREIFRARSQSDFLQPLLS